MHLGGRGGRSGSRSSEGLSTATPTLAPEGPSARAASFLEEVSCGRSREDKAGVRSVPSSPTLWCTPLSPRSLNSLWASLHLWARAGHHGLLGSRLLGSEERPSCSRLTQVLLVLSCSRAHDWTPPEVTVVLRRRTTEPNSQVTIWERRLAGGPLTTRREPRNLFPTRLFRKNATVPGQVGTGERP